MNKGQGAFLSLVMILMIIGFIVLMIGFDTVDASHIGVKNKFGVLHGTMQPGMAWTGMFMDVYSYDLRMRQMHIEMYDESSAVDKDGQSIYADIEINYRLNPDNVEDAYAKIGKDKDIATILNLEGIIKEGFKSTTSKYNSLEIFQKRGQVKDDAIEKIKENFPSDYFILENVIISNLDFNPAFKEAIEAKKVAEETAKAREKEVDISKFEADKKIEEARGAAESKLIIAKSEAEALRLKAQEITPLMVQNNWIDAWNGIMPQYMVGGDTSMLMQMPALGDAE